MGVDNEYAPPSHSETGRIHWPLAVAHACVALIRERLDVIVLNFHLNALQIVDAATDQGDVGADLGK